MDSFDYGASVKKLKNWIDLMCRDCPTIGYLVVPEKHKSGRFHFHGIFKDCDGLGFIPSGINKDLCQVAFNKKRYWASRNLDEPKICEVILDSEKLKKLVNRPDRDNFNE